MMDELLRDLLAFTIASSSAIVITLSIREPVQRAFGSIAAYSTWLLVPAAMIAVILPSVPGAGSAPGLSLQIEPVAIVNRALNAIDRGSSVSGATSFEWRAWLLGAWGTGAVLCLLYLAGLQRVFISSLGTLSGSRCVLRAQTSAGCPALIGVFRPKVILPPDFETRYSRLERLLVLAHERVHLRRRDAVWNAVVAALRCIFWFNPLVHLAASYFRVDQELACDAAVMERHPGSRRIYAGAMLKTEVADAALPIGCHWQSVRQFKQRLEILKRSAPSRMRQNSGLVLVALASVAVGYAAWAAEPATPTEAAMVLTIEVGEEVLSLDGDSLGPVELAAPPQEIRVEQTPSGSQTVTGNLLHLTFNARPQGQVTGTITRPSQAGRDPEAISAPAVELEGNGVISTPRDGYFSANFEKGCTVRFTNRSITGPVCRMHGYSAPKR